MQNTTQTSKTAIDLLSIYRHKQLVIINLLQSVFSTNKYSKALRMLSSDIILFRSLNDVRMPRMLASQMFGSNMDHFLRSYNSSTKKPFGYLVCSMSPLFPYDDKFRLRTGLLPGERLTLFLPNT